MHPPILETLTSIRPPRASFERLKEIPLKPRLVIGTGPGIGLATAQRLARNRYPVLPASRTGKVLADHLDALRAKRVDAIVDTVDVRDRASVGGLVDRYADALAVMHENAGVPHYEGEGQPQARPLSAETPASIERETRVNLVGGLAAVRATTTVLGPRNTGSTVLTGGGFGAEPTPDFVYSSVGKAGLRGSARALAEPLKTQGIHLAPAPSAPWSPLIRTRPRSGRRLLEAACPGHRRLAVASGVAVSLPDENFPQGDRQTPWAECPHGN